MTRTLAALLSLGMLVSCGSTEEKDPFPDAEAFCKAWAERACNPDVVDACSQEPSRGACRRAQAEFCESLVEEDDYRRAGAEACLDFVEDAYKDARLSADEAAVVLRLAAPCAQVTGKGGVICNENLDCEDINGGICEENAIGTGICRISGGRSCSSSGSSTRCASDFFCDGSNCLERVDEDEPCESDAQCDAQFRCDIPEDETEGLCVSRNSASEECATDIDCESGFCWNGLCVNRITLSDIDPVCDDLS